MLYTIALYKYKKFSVVDIQTQDIQTPVRANATRNKRLTKFTKRFSELNIKLNARS